LHSAAISDSLVPVPPRASRADGPFVPEILAVGRDRRVKNGGELPGTPSTVVDLRAFESDGRWSIAREGAISVAQVAARLESAP